MIITVEIPRVFSALYCHSQEKTHLNKLKVAHIQLIITVACALQVLTHFIGETRGSNVAADPCAAQIKLLCFPGLMSSNSSFSQVIGIVFPFGVTLAH